MFRIAIRNLACFEELNLESGREALLLGQNGAGKSTLFDVLFSLRSLINLGTTTSATFPNYQVSTGQPQIELEVHHRGRDFRYSVVLAREGTEVHSISSGPQGLVWNIRRETLSQRHEGITTELSLFDGGHFRGSGLPGEVDLLADRSPLATVKFPPESPVHYFKQWIGGVWLLRLEPRQMTARAESPAEELHISGRNFAAWFLTYRRRRRAMERIAQALAHAIPGLLRLEFVRDGRAWVLIARFHDGSAVDFDKLSDGQRCLVVLHSCLILKRDEFTLLMLDEPDAHITPSEIYPLFEALRDLGDDARLHLMVASHHPYLIDLMAAQAPFEMVIKDGRVSAIPFTLDRSLGISAARHLVLRGHT